MGFFDFLRRRREKKDQDSIESYQSRKFEKEVKKRKKREHRQRKAREWRLLRRAVDYERIQFWIETRIGPMEELGDDDIKARLYKLLMEERKGPWKIAPSGKKFDPYAGLAAYINTNSYRRMLSDDTGREELNFQSRERLWVLQKSDPGYARLQWWLELRIGNMGDTEPEILHEQLLQFLEREKERLILEKRDPSACKGLELYIRKKKYLEMM